MFAGVIWIRYRSFNYAQGLCVCTSILSSIRLSNDGLTHKGAGFAISQSRCSPKEVSKERVRYDAS